jgi:hypothetical protein
MSNMTELLKKAFEKVSKELPDHEQDEIGRSLLNVIEQDERDWETAIAQSLPKLERLAKKALADYETGLSEPLDIKKL